MSSLSVIIVSYESGNTLDFCLATLKASLEGIDSEVIVWDNFSQKLSQEHFKSNYPWVKWIFHHENIGFGKACNEASKLSVKENLVFLNPDTLCNGDSIRPLLFGLENILSYPMIFKSKPMPISDWEMHII